MSDERVDEARRLRKVSKRDQRTLVEWLEQIAADPRVPPDLREDARIRAKSLKSLLNFDPKKRE